MRNEIIRNEPNNFILLEKDFALYNILNKKFSFSMDVAILNKDFLDLANSVDIVEKKPLKTSPYNKKLVLDECKICGKPAEETHHIVEQCEADTNGNLGYFHKNNDHNLVQLCKTCHDNVTYGNLVIQGYIDTSEGIVLKHYNVKKKRKAKKYDDVVDKIKSYKNVYDINIKNCISLLKCEEDISIGRETKNNAFAGVGNPSNSSV